MTARRACSSSISRTESSLLNATLRPTSFPSPLPDSIFDQTFETNFETEILMEDPYPRVKPERRRKPMAHPFNDSHQNL
jgi:hypothetical protein